MLVNTLVTPSHRSSIRVLWIGSQLGSELGTVYDWTSQRAEVDVFDSPPAAIAACVAQESQRLTRESPCLSTQPTLAVLSTDRPGRWTQNDAVLLSRMWPLMPIVSLASSLGDGCRRSGPTIPGVEEVLWHDFICRFESWQADKKAGRCGTLGLPATVRREERFLEATTAINAATVSAFHISVVASHQVDLDGLVDLLTLSGWRITHAACGRPSLNDPATALIWDAGSLGASQLAWLAMLTASRPACRIVVLDSFPRGDSTRAAIAAGAAAVLGRPLSLETLKGTFLTTKPQRRMTA